MDCGIAMVAMRAGLPYTKAKAFCPKRDYSYEGMTVREMITALEASTGQEWGIKSRVYPTPMRHYNPRISTGLAVVTWTSPTSAIAYVHFINIHKGRIYDPTLERSVKLDEYKAHPTHRKWMVVCELYEK
jgi:hypothetical protein